MAIRSQVKRSFKAIGARGPSTMRVAPKSSWRQTNTSSLGKATRVASEPYQTAQIAPVVGAPVSDTADYQDTMANAEYQYNAGISDLRKAETRATEDHGSRTAKMKEVYAQNQARNVNGYAANGQLYSGSLSNAQSHAQKGYLEDDNNLQTAYRRTMSDYSEQEGRLGTQRQLTRESAERQRAAAAARAQAEAAAAAQAEAASSPAAQPEASQANAFSNAMANQSAPGLKYKFVKRGDGSLWKVFSNGSSVRTRPPSKK